MYQRIAICLFILIGLTVNAQTINLRGTVSTQAGKPIANAIVTLVKQAMKDTTGTDGAYTLSKATRIELPLLKPNSQSITLYKNFLDFSLPNPSPVKIEVFDVKGNLLQKVSLQNASTGFYRFNIEENSRTAKLLVIKAAIGRDVVTLRYLPLHNGSYTVNHVNESDAPAEKNRLAKITAISDTLKTIANGFTTNVKVINSYDQALNITLDSTGGNGAKPSSGCGKARTLADSSSTSISVTGAGSRMYILSIPHDYDPNTPCALWFSIHCMGGSAEGVAHGSFGTGYQYYGIRKFANKDKGTTIFCSPQGISNMWGQGANDLNFFRAMITKFETELCIDKSRIFAEGFSMGGSMSYALACAMPDTMRAVCMHSGGAMSGCDGAHRGPVPMFITHGTEDGTCGWPGSGMPQINDLANRDGCKTEDLASECKPTDGSGLNPVCVEYKNCQTGFPCRACIFKGGHNPSPGPVKGNDWGEASTWVPDSVWSFFKRFY